MSALYTALVESETKESLATMVCDLREQRAALLAALEKIEAIALAEPQRTTREIARAAIAAARETFTTGQARNGVAP